MTSDTAQASALPHPDFASAAIVMRGVGKNYGNFQALRGVDLEVARGERIVICGPSGSGKSTLIRCINHLEQHDAGQIIVNDMEVGSELKQLQAIRAQVEWYSKVSTCSLISPFWKTAFSDRHGYVSCRARKPKLRRWPCSNG